MSLTLLSAVDAPARVRVDRRVHPAPSVDVSRMTRFRGGTYSHTVDTIVFADGSSARTDLIRLNPNIAAYSLDFGGLAPTRPSRYFADTWAAVPHLQARAHEPSLEAEVDWILRNSFPVLSTPALSARLREAGHPLGGRNITEHEAIAGTQAAIWHLTNGLDLDDRPQDVPSVVAAVPGGVRVEFDGGRQLGGYTAKVATATGVRVRLQKSADGRDWIDVAASAVTVPAGGALVTRTLGVGSTVSDHRRGGYRHYRLLLDGPGSVEELTFRLDGSPRYRNSEATVALYRYLLAGARLARAAAVTPDLDAGDAVLSGDLLGPFRLRAASPAGVRATDGHRVVRNGVADAALLVEPGEGFFLRVAPGSAQATVRVEVPGDASGFGGRVITGVVCDEVDGCTPLALAVPTQTVVEFDLDWGAY